MNVPFRRDKVQNLPKGMNLTREILGIDKEGNLHTAPNRRERRAALFPKRMTNNRKGWGSTYKQFVPVAFDKAGNKIPFYIIRKVEEITFKRINPDIVKVESKTIYHRNYSRHFGMA